MESIEKGDDDAGLKSLIDLAESTPKFLRPQLDQLISACIEVYKSTNQVNWKGLFIFEALYVARLIKKTSFPLMYTAFFFHC